MSCDTLSSFLLRMLPLPSRTYYSLFHNHADSDGFIWSAWSLPPYHSLHILSAHWPLAIYWLRLFPTWAMLLPQSWFTPKLLHGQPTWSQWAEFFTLHPVLLQHSIEGPISAFISICMLVMLLEPLDCKSPWALGWHPVAPNKHPGPNNLMNEVSKWMKSQGLRSRQMSIWCCKDR